MVIGRSRDNREQWSSVVKTMTRLGFIEEKKNLFFMSPVVGLHKSGCNVCDIHSMFFGRVISAVRVTVPILDVTKYISNSPTFVLPKFQNSTSHKQH